MARLQPRRPGRWLWTAALPVIIAGLALPVPARAASTVVWQGGGLDTNWSDAANWQGGVSPTNGDTVVIGSTSEEPNVPQTVDDIPGLNLYKLEFANLLNFQPQSVVSGDDLGIGAGGIVMDSSVQTSTGVTVSSNLMLTASGMTPIDIESNRPLSLTGVISGTGAGITKLGPGGLLLANANTFSNSPTAVDIQAGELAGTKTGALGTGGVNIANGAILEGNGTISNAITIAGPGSTPTFSGTGFVSVAALQCYSCYSQPLSITGPVSLAADATIGPGVLFYGGISLGSTSDLTLTFGGLTSSATVVYAPITGHGSLDITNGVTLATSDSYVPSSGIAAQVEPGGTLAVSAAGALGSASNQVDLRGSAATLSLGSTTFSYPVSVADGGVISDGSGGLFESVVTFAGNGTFQSQAGGFSITSPAAVTTSSDSSKSLTFNTGGPGYPGAITLNAPITGSAGITIAGNRYPSNHPLVIETAPSVPMTISTGTAEIDTTQGSVTLAGQPIIAGNGQLNGTSSALAVSPSIEPGANIEGNATPLGTLAITGAFTGSNALSSQSSIIERILGTSSGVTYPGLNISASGPVPNGANLIFNVLYTSAVGDSYTILNDSDGLVGTFAGLPNNAYLNGSDGQPYQITYTTTAVSLHRVAVTSTTVSAAPNPQTYPSTVTITATVNGIPTVFPGDQVTFYDGSVNLGSAALNVNGTASLSVAGLQGGAHSLSASFPGNSTAAPSSSAVYTETIDPEPTSVSASTSPNPSTYGQVVTITATITPSGAPGQIRFDVDHSPNPCGWQWIVSGTASCQVSSMSAGTHVVDVVYPGDVDYGSSFSTDITQVVNPASTQIQLTASSTSVPFATPLPVTASVTSAGPTVTEGTVAFAVDGNVVPSCAAVPVTSASCDLPGMTPGQHSLSATYSGGADFTGSRSGKVAVTAGPSHLVVMDAFGGLHPLVGATLNTAGASYWPGWAIARGIAVRSDGSGGYTLDGFGGVHAFGLAPPVAPSGYWPGWDIARAITLDPCDTSRSSGYVLDGFGGIHPFGGAPAVTTTGYWTGWDIARSIAVNPCSGGVVSGYVLDGFGGIHSFSSGAAIASPSPSAYWAGWDIARGVAITSVGKGYVVDGFGGLHPFGGAPGVAPSGYWPGWDIARGIVAGPSGGGWVLDGFGDLHPFGGTPAMAVTGYWPGWDVARSVSGP